MVASLPTGSPSVPGASLASASLTDAYTDIRGLKNLPTDGHEALRRVASQFESMFMDLWLKSMRESGAVFAEGNYFSSPAVETHQQMLDHQWAVHMGNAGGVGIGDALVRQLSPGVPAEADAATAASAETAHVAIPPRRGLPSGNVAGVALSGADQPEASTQLETFGRRTSLFENAGQFVDELLPVIQDRLGATPLNPVAVLAQAALETGWGQKIIHDAAGRPSFNLFGIKSSGWDGDSVTVSSLEQEFGRMSPRASEFRVYNDWEESVSDYLGLLSGDERYASVLDAGADVKAFARSLQSAGYATDPGYADKLLGIVAKLQRSFSVDHAGSR